MAYDNKPANWQFPLDEARKTKSLSVIRKEAEKKRIRSYPTFFGHVWNQLRFQSWKHWLTQGSILLAAMILALKVQREHIGDLDTLAICSVFFVFAGNICLSHVARLFSWHMAELEQTLYLNLRQMVCIRMLEAGIIDLLILALFLGITGPENSIGIGASLTYMLVPFLWSDTLYLHMLVNLRGIFGGFRSFGLGILCGAAALFPVLWEPAYDPKHLAIWQALAAAGLILLIAEVASILGKTESGEHIYLD